VDVRVSLVIANYNYGRYVGEAIESVLAQSFGAIELIVIDDASQDASREVLRRHAGDPRVRLVFHERNQGNIASYNEGLALARGEFLGIVCADDLCLRADAVARQVAVFDAHPDVGFVYSAQIYVDEHGKPFRMFQPWPADYVRAGHAEFADLALRNYVPNTGTLVRRAAHERLGFYDPELPHAGDWELWLRIASRFQVAYLAEPLYAYRIHGRNLSVAGHSPRQANREIALAVRKGFAALPADAPADLRALEPDAVRHSLLATAWGDRSLGRVRRSWIGIADAGLRSPSLLVAPMFYGAVAKITLLTLLGLRRYERLAAWRSGSVATTTSVCQS
jgi:glycosyltransferase involved in cell wall biosynthesis